VGMGGSAGKPSEVTGFQRELQTLNDTTIRAGRDGDTGTVTIACECGRADCSTPLSLSRAVYQHVRQHTARAIVRTGHEVPEVSRVIQHRGTISIIESTYVGDH
jgi:hypothetical protein